MYSKYGIMDSIAQLNLPLTVRNNRTVLNIGEDFFIYDVTKQKIPSDPFKINIYVCHICLCGESKGKINLSPYDIESDMMAINIPGQIVEQEFMSEDYHGICILMSERFVSGLGLPYNYQTYMALQECPILKLQQGQMDAMLTYCAMVRKLFKVHHPNKVEVIKHLTWILFPQAHGKQEIDQRGNPHAKVFHGSGTELQERAESTLLCRFTAPVCRIFIHNHKKMQRKKCSGMD